MAVEIVADPTESMLGFFGNEVLRLRTERGWSQDQLATEARTNRAYISYIETAKRVPSEDLANALDSALETGGHFRRLYPLVLRYSYPSWFLPFVQMESEAVRMRVFESQIIPGLLQTEPYARAMLASGRPDTLDDLVAARMSRQDVLTGEGEARPRVTFVVDEQALHRPIGGNDVMRDQLAHLLATMEHPRTVLQVVPSKVSAHPGLAGPFTVLSHNEGPDVLYVDAFGQGRMALESHEVAEASHAYDLLMGVALSPHDSADMIRTLMEALK